jgi:hypothetical protein
MKSMKKLLCAGLVITMALTFTACNSDSSGTSTTKATEASTTAASTFDNDKATALAEELVNEGVFEAEMASVSEDIVTAKYEISDPATCIAAYRSTTMNPEEITIINQGADNDITELVDTYLATQKSSYESYMPEEVKKIENVIRKQTGDYVIIVVCNDTDKANEIIEKYL